MKNIFKKSISFILSLVFVFSACAFAVSAEDEASGDLVFYGGSTIKSYEYANNKNITSVTLKIPSIHFVPVDGFTEGDVNNDGTVNSADALATVQTIVKSRTLNAFEEAMADINNDGIVNSLDALRILRTAVS